MDDFGSKDLFSDKYAFESDDLDAVTAEMERVLGMEHASAFYVGFGGVYSVFGAFGAPGGRLRLTVNHDEDEYGHPRVMEEGFPEMGLILLIEQEETYVDYGPKLRRMSGFEPVLLEKRRYTSATKSYEILHDLAKER